MMLWVTGSLRLFMEWMMVPIFAVALQAGDGWPVMLRSYVAGYV